MGYIREIEATKKKVVSNKTMTQVSKKLRLKPLNEKIKEHRKVMRKYEKVRSKHLGILDKLPKDSPLYNFAYNCSIAKKLKDIADKKIKDERDLIETWAQDE